MPLTILSVSAVALVTSYLNEAGKGAAKAVGSEAAKAVLDWMRGKLGGRAKEALEDLEKAPEAEDNQADLRKQLTKALEADPMLAEELRKLLPEGALNAAQTMIVSGRGAVGVQVAGSGNRVSTKADGGSGS